MAREQLNQVMAKIWAYLKTRPPVELLEFGAAFREAVPDGELFKAAVLQLQKDCRVAYYRGPGGEEYVVGSRCSQCGQVRPSATWPTCKVHHQPIRGVWGCFHFSPPSAPRPKVPIARGLQTLTGFMTDAGEARL